MSGENLVIVESPAKAKTINKYLGSGYKVLASYGHVRDLPPKDGSVRPDDDFAMEWELGDRSKKHVSEIAEAAKGADIVYLATDPDREGEAISWHVQEVLRSRRGLAKTSFKRIVFNEITSSAVNAAIANPREVNQELVEAYLARRALDYLVGFTLSPVLWRKLPGAKSAGRVQSVALRLICEREAEIEDFRPREYWSIETRHTTVEGQPFGARLTHADGKKLDRFDIPDEKTATELTERLRAQSFGIAKVERKEAKRNPYPPFTTSTLQQEASRKLGFSASQTMRVAQRLYEGISLDGETVGLITYMRTDGIQLAQEAITQTRSVIARSFGDNYVPSSPRVYKSKAKNAQEAHEAIRPTDPARSPDKVRRFLDSDQARLYDLIWKRTIACQMESAILDQVAVDLISADKSLTLRATGSIVKFDGFLRVYTEDRDDPADDEKENDERRLPPMAEGQDAPLKAVDPNQHFTQPPPRYTEASLVKRLEELGIGRPSTYASIIQVLQDRDYVRIEKKRFYPEDRGRIVTAFLQSYFHRYVEYDFTASMEERLDDISGGHIDWKTVLREFWVEFHRAIEQTKDLKVSDVIDALDRDLGPHFFPPQENGADPRRCPSCADGRLGLKLARTGAFIGCSNYPDCRFTRPLEVVDAEKIAEGEAFPRHVGTDPESGLDVTVRKGPFGFYLQLGEATEDQKPKRASLPKNYEPLTVDLETALALLALPRTVGNHPEDQKTISAGIGRFGPYVRHAGTYKSIPADEDVLTIGMNRAVQLLSEATPRKQAEPLRELGAHPEDGEPVGIFKGRYGPYVKHGKVMASLPKGTEPDELTMDSAVTLIEAKRASAGKGKATKSKAAKTGTAKTGTAKKAGTRTAATKTAATKTAATKTAATKTGAAKKPAAKKAAGAKAGNVKTAASKTGASTAGTKSATSKKTAAKPGPAQAGGDAVSADTEES
ncbi:type I DNA topoisomerase [Fodinicurvata sp. EGI_FJ10296]|uniref:type I DNA topoisomerase n=1 Tax=Fodinicurvata sp. EGI_FJ10296 TaxID=3231908 RepID=UPI003455DC50